MHFDIPIRLSDVKFNSFDLRRVLAHPLKKVVRYLFYCYLMYVEARRTFGRKKLSTLLPNLKIFKSRDIYQWAASNPYVVPWVMAQDAFCSHISSFSFEFHILFSLVGRSISNRRHHLKGHLVLGGLEPKASSEY